MKKLFLYILVFIFCKIGVAQTPSQKYPVPQTIGSDSTDLLARAAVRAGAGFVNSRYADTTAANLRRIKYYDGAQIWTRSGTDAKLWLRDSAQNKWTEILTSVIYPASDTLVWRIGGNYLEPLSSDLLATLGSRDSIGLYFQTNGTRRLYLPPNGINRSSGAANKYLMMDTTNLFMYYGDGGSGGESSYTLEPDSLMTWAIRGTNWDASYYYGNVYLGTMWPVNQDFYECFNESWVKPDSLCEYVISDDYGGSHTILFGFSGGGTTLNLTGNMYHDATQYSFAGVDAIKTRTVHHIAVGYDRTKIVCFMDGVPSGEVAMTATRRRASGTGEGWILGSDHSKFDGWLFMQRHYEGFCPVDLGKYFSPQRRFYKVPGDGYHYDFTTPTRIVKDNMSLYGEPHAAVLNSNSAIANPYANYSTDNIYDSTLPKWEKVSMAQTANTGAASSIPVGAVVFDDFTGRTYDIAPAWRTYAIDSTMGGTAGKLKYTSNGLAFGIINEQCWMERGGGATPAITVTTGVTNQDIRVSTTIGNKQLVIYGRYTDASNLIYLLCNGDGTTYLVKYIAGVQTALGSFTTGSFTTLRLEISGTTANVYEDATLKISAADVSGVTSSTKAGFGVNTNYTRVKKFEVY